MRRQAAAAANGDFPPYPFLYREYTTAAPFFPISVPNGGAGVAIQFDVTNNQGATYFDTPTNNTFRTLNQGAGIVGAIHFTAQAKWEAAFAGQTELKFNFSAFGWNVGAYFEEVGGAAGDFGTAQVLDFVKRVSMGGVSTGQLQIRQSSGAARNLESAFMEVAFRGTAAGPGNAY